MTEVVAVEPEVYLRQRAEEAAAKAPCRSPSWTAWAASYPLPMRPSMPELYRLCTIPEPDAALRDLFRVIRPRGELRFYEHVRANTPRLQRLQDTITRSRVWPFFAGGCHPNRDSGATIERAGFVIENCRRFAFKPCFCCASAALTSLATHPNRTRGTGDRYGVRALTTRAAA